MNPDGSSQRGKNGDPAQGRRSLDGIAALVPLFFGLSIVMMIVSVVLSVAAFKTANRVDNNAVKIEQLKDEQALRNRERRENIHQTCLLFEADHKADVDQLRDTYNYLDRITPVQRKESINAGIIASLPNLEREAATDSAPEFCDEQGVGLPEPDPVQPERPKFLPPQRG